MDIYVLQLSQDYSKIKSKDDKSPAVRMTTGVERTGSKDDNRCRNWQ